jgi:hypothetical protein
VCRKRGASDGDNEAHIDDGDDNNGGIDMQPTHDSKKQRTVRRDREKRKNQFFSFFFFRSQSTDSSSSSGSGGTDSGAQQERFKLLQERVTEAKRDKEDAKRKMAKAERELDKANLRLAALEAAKASDVAIERAQNNVESARSAWQATIEAHKTAMQAETAAYAANRGGAASGAQVVSFAFKPDVLERLKRPLSEWQACETFDVTGFGVAVRASHFHDVLFLRAQGLDVLRLWETKRPHLVIDGSPGMGKSSLLQVALLRALVRGDPVLYVTGDEFMLMRMLGESFTAEVLLWKAMLGSDGRPPMKETVVCYDSPLGFHSKMGNADVYKATFIVHSPSADVNNSRKAGGFPLLYLPPSPDELTAIGKMHNIDAAEVDRRVTRFGPSIRYLVKHETAEEQIKDGISKVVPRGVDGLTDISGMDKVAHRILLVQSDAAGDRILTFASDFIRDQVVNRMAKSHVFDLLRLANTVDIHGSLRGQVFENRMLDTLGRANAKILFKTFKTAGGDKVLEIAGDGVTLCKADGALTLPAGSRLQDLVLYRPPHSNNASWDALLVESGSVAYLLQMTVAKDHPVKQQGLAAGKALLASAGFVGKVRLVFLLPPAAFSGFRVPQTILTADGKAVAAGTANEWPQEKWCVDKVDDIAFWPQQQK